MVRGPVWSGFTKLKLESVIRATEGKALVGLVAGVVKDYLPLVDEYYYCKFSPSSIYSILTNAFAVRYIVVK